MAAQLGVAPVLVPVFGGVPVASLPANLLAIPAAGPVMMWGLAAGLPAGVLGGVVARVVCIPTEVLIAWIGGVARWSAGAPVGQLRVTHVLLLLSVVLAGAVVRSRRGRALLLAAAMVVVAQPAVVLAAGPHAWDRQLAPGLRLWRDGGSTVLVADTGRGDDLLRAIRDAGVRRIDLLVLGRPSRAVASAADILLSRVPAQAVVGPPGIRLERAPISDAQGEVTVGTLVATLDPSDRGLTVRVRRTHR
jgi:competence protein ComEC